MAPNLTIPVRIKVIQYAKQDKLNFTKISNRLRAEGIQCSRLAAAKIYKKYALNGMIKNKLRNERVIKITQEHKDEINEWINSDREITSRVLVKNLRSRFNVTISLSQLCRVIKKLGWEKERTKYCQIVSKVNKVKRVGYAFLCQITDKRFENCIFIDESSIKIELHTLFRWYKSGEKKRKCGVPKKPLKVHVLAGPSPICVFEGDMNSDGYQNILTRNFVGLIHETFPGGHRFVSGGLN
jgi:transposase